MTVPTGVEAWLDHRDIAHLLARYCHCCDDGDFAALVSLFTTDGTFAYGRVEATGPQALTDFFVAAQPPERRGKHLTTNAVVDLDGDAADVTSDFVFLNFRDGALVPSVAGRYVDRLVRRHGTWLIQRRDARALSAP